MDWIMSLPSPPSLPLSLPLLFTSEMNPVISSPLTKVFFNRTSPSKSTAESSKLQHREGGEGR